MKKKPARQSFCFFATTHGQVLLSWRDTKICSLRLPVSDTDVSEDFSMPDTWQKADEREIPGCVKKVRAKIQSYYQGEVVSFKDVAIDLEGLSPFIQKTLRHLQSVEWGETITYKQLAQLIGSPGGARAMGQAMGKNPVPLIIPCHRVICSDGRIGGFSAAGGIQVKSEMLRLEEHQLGDSAMPVIQPPLTLKNVDLRRAIEHLRGADKGLGHFIAGAPQFNLAPDAMISSFQALLEAIVYQQLTGKAAATIFSRLLGLFSRNGTIAPLDIIRADDDELRAAGLSGAKIAAARDLAEFAISGRLPEPDQMKTMTNTRLINLLSQIRGIGTWTVQMLLIFKLGRADIIPFDDYGLKKGLAVIRRQKTLPTVKDLRLQAEAWKPYRSIASWYLWRAAESSENL